MNPATDTYPMPTHGWTCYFCGETFRTPGAAADHFGADPEDRPACIMFDELGMRGIVMALRKAESRARRFEARAEQAEYLLGTTAADFQRITSLQAAHGVALEIDFLEGRAQTAEAIIADIETRWPQLVEASRRRICNAPFPQSKAKETP